MRAPTLLIAALAAATGCRAGEAAPGRVAALPAEVAPGLGIYVARCEGCHGPDARGTRAGPSLLGSPPDPAWEARLVRSLRDGVPPTPGTTWTVRGMPPVPMAPADAARLVTYLRWLAAGALPATPES